MSCSNCGWQLVGRHLDNQTVFHCGNCGSTFFEENGINRISLASALQLSADKKNDEISGDQKRCPKDGNRLTAILNDEAIPRGVTLLRCDSCRGVFAYPDDLIQFKKAQNAKVDYYKMWQAPFSSLKTVIVLSFILFISFGTYLAYNTLQNTTNRQIQASDQIKNLSITSSGRFVFMTFQTNSSVRSQIIFNDKTTNEITIKNIADKPTKNHVFTTTELNLGDEITYQLVIYPQKGSPIKTNARKLLIAE